MSSVKGQQYHEIPIVIDGQAKILKSVTKFTTCNDVINKVPKTGSPVAVFQTINGEEKELKGKTKLLKIWRSHGSSKKSVFTVKQSEGGKSRRLSLNIFGGRNRRSLEPASNDKLKQVSDLAFNGQYQKSKLQKMATAAESSNDRNMQKVNSTSSMDSMDAFLDKADHEKMGQILDFCNIVTSRHLGDTHTVKQSERETPHMILRPVIKDSLKTMRLGFKKTLKSTFSSTNKTASASTLKSADTGYQSVAGDMRDQTSVKPQTLRTVLLQDVDGIQRHSTPVNSSSKRRNTCERTDVTLTATPTVPIFDENEGKSVLMERFMNDTTVCEAGTYNGQTIGANQKFKGTRSVSSSQLVLFRSQEEKCRFYWNRNCDSDDDSSYAATIIVPQQLTSMKRLLKIVITWTFSVTDLKSILEN